MDMDIDEKSSPNTDTTFANAGTQTSCFPEEFGKAGSPTTEAKALLRALRNVIIPFVRPADESYKYDANQNALGPDGEEFVLALQKFVLSFLYQRPPVGGVEVELKEKGGDVLDAESQATSDDSPSPKNVADVALNMEPPRYISAPEENTNQNSFEAIELYSEESQESEYECVVSISGSPSVAYTDIFGQRKTRFIENALKALREHVFNTMPIRLLCIKPQSSKLQITLLERSEIWVHIASSFKNIDFAVVSKELTRYEQGTVLLEQRAEQSVIWELIRECCRYAISSHTWLHGASGEVTYGDWIRGEFDPQRPGYQKLVNFCKAAWEDHGVTFGWMDTICINKDSSAELDESIRSMYKWYSNSYACVAYLADTVTLSDMPSDTWFTRGWTLQELLAPYHIKFYNTHWNKLVESTENDKRNTDIRKQIEKATSITAYELQSKLTSLSISRKMQMAAMRQVTREEDSAYCLMGIFEVSISTAYGEGAERAFSRLLQEIINSSDDVIDIFNWAGPCGSRISHLLPPDPQSYRRRSSDKKQNVLKKPIEPLMLTHVGLRITIILMPAISIRNPTPRYDAIRDYHAITEISFLNPDRLYEDPLVGGSYSVLDARISDGDGWKKEANWYQLTLGILNIGGGKGLQVAVPKDCLAVVLEYDSMGEACKLPTTAPIVFTLNNRPGSDNRPSSDENDENWNDFYYIERSELASHGMKLDTIYL